MSYLVAAPEFLVSAASDLEGIRSMLGAAHAAAAAPTAAVLAAGADEVSSAIASLFSGHGQAYQALSAQAATFHQQFVQALSAGAMVCRRRGGQCRCFAYRSNRAQRGQRAHRGVGGPPTDRQRR